ncbi:MAG TPA: HAD-IIA family hydrolase [bacterium]|nr:HAD-IIA family hydrolase [bacterium]
MSGIEGALLDIDGTILDGGAAIPGAADALAQLKRASVAVLLATNTSRKSRGDVAGSLHSAGIPAEERDIFSSVLAAATKLNADGVRRIFPLLTPAALPDLNSFELTDQHPEVVLIGDMGGLFTFDLLNQAFLQLRAGARLVAAQKNRYWKGEHGLQIDAGAFVAALEYAAETKANVMGKPAPAFFQNAAQLLQKPARSVIVVGDSLESDVAGGRAAGMKTVLVRTGLYDEKKLEDTPPRERPDFVIDSVRDLPKLLETW